jgi:hypothetical protein
VEDRVQMNLRALALRLYNEAETFNGAKKN